jgi:hypothetical protein
MHSVLIRGVALSALIPLSLAAQKVTGLVLESTGQPVVGASISVADSSSRITGSDVTDAAGRFEIPIGSGRFSLRAQRIGFTPAETEIVLSGSQSITVELRLSALPKALDTVRTVGEMDRGMEEFEERRRQGIGKFFTRADIARFDNERTSMILSNTIGLRLIYGKGGEAYAASSHGPTSMRFIESCYATVYVDGLLAYTRGRTGMPYFDVNSIAPPAIEAIEYYSSVSKTPAKFMGFNDSCGLLVIHSRR